MRRENLILNQIPESENENCKEKVLTVLDDVGIDTGEIKFHAVHRLGKKRRSTQPIIARFVLKEDRDFVLSWKNEIRKTSPNAYITQDYARAIRNERKMLISAMTHGRNQGVTNIKVLDRFLDIRNEKYSISNLPSHLKDEE